MVGKGDPSVFAKGDIQVAVAVFDGIADQIPEDPGAGIAVEEPGYISFGQSDPGSDPVLFQRTVVSGDAFLKETVQIDGLRGCTV